MQTYDLRRAQDADAPAVAAVWESAWHDGHDGNVPEELVAIRTAEDFRNRVAERISQTTVAVDSVSKEVAGFVTVAGDEAEQVFVSSAHRGTGVAALLLDEAERQIAAAGYAEAWLAVATGNARARRFYERRGWTDGGAFEYTATVPGGTIAVACHRYVKPV